MLEVEIVADICYCKIVGSSIDSERSYCMKIIKRFMVGLLLIAFMLNYFTGYNCYIYADTKNSIYEEYIPEEAYVHAEKNYKNGLKYILDNPDFYGIYGSEKDFELCEPYIVYDVEKDVQEPLYYFPIKNNHEQIVLVMSVFLTESGWSDSISKSMADELNDKDYLGEECLVYADDDEICVENKNSKISVAKVNGRDIKEFVKKGFESKKQEVRKNYKVDFNIKLVDEDDDCKAQSKILISSKTDMLLDTSNRVVNQKVNDEQKDICWAATVGTIYNYIKDKNITAKDVCDKVKHKYTAASNETILKAFDVHELTYRKVDSTLDYDRIRGQLKERKPIAMWTKAKNKRYSHMVTLVGINLSEHNQPRITIWNSATEQYECTAYLGNDTAFGMGSSTYCWIHSYCFFYK